MGNATTRVADPAQHQTGEAQQEQSGHDPAQRMAGGSRAARSWQLPFIATDNPSSLNPANQAVKQARPAEVEQLLGPDRDRWAWGRLHVARLAHPLSPLLDEETRARLAVGPAPRGGSGDTVGNTAYLADTFVQTGGATFRIVVDVGDWDGSLVMNSPGQSGDPDSPHYADLFAPWSRGEAFPLNYSRDRVEATTEQRIRLRPPSDPDRPAG